MAGSIWWVRRDLRLHDNPALSEALLHGPVTPVFILDPAVIGSRVHRNAKRRTAFLFAGLRQLDRDLHARGSRLVVRIGKPSEELPRLLSEADANAVFATEDYSPYARKRDTEVGATLDLRLTGGVAVRHPDDVRTAGGEPFRVFTPYRRAWERLGPLEPPLPAPGRLPAVPEHLGSAPLPDTPPALLTHQAGEAAAQELLERFLRVTIASYGEERNRLDRQGTSCLSPYFHFGMISPRACAVAALDAGSGPAEHGATAWLNELIWRDFYLAVLYHFPTVLTAEFDPRLREIPWRNAPRDIEAWRNGETGIPIVDAAMRQLRHTGWIHNRARMIVASFLVKHLLCDWRIGEQWFMDQLIDGDIAANNGGWQWSAGTGTDAAPYFRIFNPVRQGQQFDPEGAFVRRWLPELDRVPGRYIHEPWKMPTAIQLQAGVRIGRDYPAPIIDLAEGRRRALLAYESARKRS